MQPCAVLPRVHTVEALHQATQQESKDPRTRGSLPDVSRHLPKLFVDQSGHVGSRGLIRGDCTHERFMEGEVPTRNP